MYIKLSSALLLFFFFLINEVHLTAQGLIAARRLPFHRVKWLVHAKAHTFMSGDVLAFVW